MNTIINGKVLFKHIENREVLVNIETKDNKKLGFVLGCAENLAKAYPQLWVAMNVCQDVTLNLQNGQVMSLSADQKNFDLKGLNNVGVKFRDKPERKLMAKFLKCVQRGNSVKLFLTKGESSFYTWRCQNETDAVRVCQKLGKSKRNDALVLQQEADGSISSVVNTTQAFEVNC